MAKRIRLSTVLIVCITTTFAVTCLVSVLPMTADSCICTDEPSQRYGKKRLMIEERSGHRLAILVPFRDRFDELLTFAPHMDKFLTEQKIPHHIFVINQVDQYRFNRASLINIGFLQTKEDYDYIAMHDVDLLPLNPDLKYNYPEFGPFHVASPDLHPRYHYATFVGGILLVSREHFQLVGGMSNRYWGWGLEDDEFYVRLREAKLNVTRPSDVLTDTTNTFKHVHDKAHRKRDTAKCYNQREITRKRDRETGLHDVAFKILTTNNLTIDGVPVTVFNVELECNKVATPWCDCSKTESPKSGQKSGKGNKL